ncbi:MAG: Uma2 family endonuclease, partial [Tepidiformaceae bacterium]
MAQPKHAEPIEAERPPTVVRVGMTAEEYFAMPETMQPQNLIEGRLYVSPAPILRHEDIVLELAGALRDFRRDDGGYVILSPTDCQLGDRTVLQPDLGYVSKEHLGILSVMRVHGAPDLVIEVLSPGTRRFDRQKKLDAYAANGVREAWL